MEMSRGRRTFVITAFIGFGLMFIIYYGKDVIYWKRIHISESKAKELGDMSNQQSSFNGQKQAKSLMSLDYEIGVLRDAIVRANSQPLLTAVEPTCQGDLLSGEVEDLLCMSKPKYLEDVRNPCWWDKTGNLKCLPFFHILGIGKSGSTDLWDRITSHPDIIRNAALNGKEARFWGKGRYGLTPRSDSQKVTRTRPIRFKDYTNMFRNVTSYIKWSLQKHRSEHKVLITGDGTPSDLMEFRGWPHIAQNRGRNLPHVLTPHLMKHIYPNTTKFIIIIRNPIERMYSGYYKVSGGTSPSAFHQAVLTSIHILTDCILQRGLRECFFDDQIYHDLPVRLFFIDYTLYIVEWLKVFPRNRFLFLKNEEYSQDIAATVQRCWDFLGLRPLTDERLNKIANRQHQWLTVKKHESGPMWLSTRKILEEIIEPSIHFLPELLKDNRFTWNFDEIVPVVMH